MAKEVIQVEVEKSAYELMVALSNLAGEVKAALKDGFQPGQDIPVLVMDAVHEIPGIMAQMSGAPSDLAEDKIEFIKGANLGLYELVAAVLK